MMHLLAAVQTDDGLLGLAIIIAIAAFIGWLGGEQNQRNKG